MNGWRQRCALVLGCLVVLTEPALTPADQAPATRTFLRGMVVSCPRGGQIWGTSDMARSLEELASLGVDWIAIHPYARVERDGSVQFRAAADTEFLRQAVTIAEKAGIALFWKPHLAYWGSFGWRGDIQFGEDELAWSRFFDSYQRFIVDQAAFAERAGIRLFAVGVEYEKTIQHETEWRRIVAAVRRVYSGRLTYAANWDGVDRVPFWDAVDLIGVHAYFPLTQDDVPDRRQLWRAWDAPLDQLQQLSRRHGDKPVLFAEIGYPRSSTAAREPWLAENDDRPEVRSLRRALVEVALQRIEAEPFIEGMFWWKWIPGDDRWDRDFSMRDSEARQALASHWAASPATAPTAQ